MTIAYLGHTDATLYYGRDSNLILLYTPQKPMSPEDTCQPDGTSLHPLALKWCEDLGIRIVDFGVTTERFILRFATPADAFAFKMRCNLKTV
ncbi:MAG: hypothetical protein EOP84_26270 [Verrucomicrobiaceae bacterium]|nr:MAG: hypothetical protein EOP84_26270 [Verrucomicrobiaceae bacterium]